jgi:hypothetical protein
VKEQSCKTYWARIYIAGDVAHAKKIIRKYVWEEGLCVTVTPLDYIYTGGEEAGIMVELINYPRFPAKSSKITETAVDLGMTLMHKLYQRSFSVVTPDDTVRYTRGEEVESRRTK